MRAQTITGMVCPVMVTHLHGMGPNLLSGHRLDKTDRLPDR